MHDYLLKFTEFNNYRHKVLTKYNDSVYSMPINLETINRYYNRNFNPIEAKEFIEDEISRWKIENPSNLEEKAISLIGKPLYEAFIKGYTQKQWETPLTELPASIINRLPVRFNYNDRYFSDPYEGIPVNGYGAIFEKMLLSDLIDIKLNTDFFDLHKSLDEETFVIYTGPIDRYYDYKYGVLGWRTLDFEIESIPVADYQGTSVMNYANTDVAFTRIHEFKHYHPERRHSEKETVIFKEYSRFAKEGEDPYYPINTNSDKETYSKYKSMASKEDNVHFGGRLGTYSYLDMDKVVAHALHDYKQLKESGKLF